MTEERRKVEVLVIGSGAGGAVTALELAQSGMNVMVLEEGKRHSLDDYGASSYVAMQRLYRNRGMTPIMGSVPIGFVEGRCLGGSTEINSGFWHRTPPEILSGWRDSYGLADATPEQLAPHFEWAENLTHVGKSTLAWPASTSLFAEGAKAMGWTGYEVPRMAKNCQHTNSCASGCPKGAKQGMSVSLIPLAQEAGATVLTGVRVRSLIRRGNRIEGVYALRTVDGTDQELLRIDVDTVVVCAGPTQTPVLLRRSGITFNVGNSLRIHPMLKLYARYDSDVNAQNSVLPLVQISEFWPDISLGGSYFTSGHLAMGLSDNWKSNRSQMKHHRRMAGYYVAVRGSEKGSVRPSRFSESTTLKYQLSNTDVRNLSQGLSSLALALLAGGAVEVFPGVSGMPSISSAAEALEWMEKPIPKSRLNLTAVHAFSACPAGEMMDRCAANSFGKVHNFENLYINDASMLPNSTGVNPQGSIMALARRNAMHLAQSQTFHQV